MKNFKLSNGIEIPCIGYGTWLTPEGDVCVNSVKEALNAGYRHIDTAWFYKNEKSIGEGIRDFGIKRDEVFITSKVWNSDRGYENTKKAFYRTIDNLKTDYLDLYLIHWPAAAHQYENWEEINLGTWSAMCELYKEGKIKAIGVSNFLPHHLDALLKTEIIPMVNQIEYHPGQMQNDVVDCCRKNNILVEAWSPLGRGKMFDNDLLITIGEKYSKSVPQICIKWCLQNGVLPLPKTVTKERIVENINVFDFEISDEDMKKINNLEYFGGSGHNPDKVNF